MIKFLKRGFRKRSIAGFVEWLDDQYVSGWALSLKNKPLSLVLRVGTESYPLEPRWFNRPDVSATQRGSNPNPGFSCTLDAIVSSSVKKAYALGITPVLLVNNKPLPLVESVRVQWQTVLLKFTPLDRKIGLDSRLGPMEGGLLHWGHFSITGWIATQACDLGKLSLRSNGVGVPCVLGHTDARITRSESGLIEEHFTLEIPAGVWAHCGEEKSVKLDLCYEGIPLEGSSLELNQEQVLVWAEAITQMPPGAEKDYLSGLALEHLREAQCAKALPYPVISRLGERFDPQKLWSFLRAKPGHLSQEDPVRESDSTLQLWKAMRVLNKKRLASRNAGVVEHIKCVLTEQEMNDEVRCWFLNLGIQLTCESGEFADLVPLLDMKAVTQMAYSDSAEAITLAIPALVHDNRIEEAGQALARLKDFCYKGWFHSYCIHFATQQVLIKSRNGQVRRAAAEKYRYAFLEFIEALRQDWFLRLHDLQLTRVAVLLLEDFENQPKWAVKDTCAVVLRCYGLSPAFWERVKDNNAILKQSQIKEGLLMWDVIHSSLEQWAAMNDHADLNHLIQAIAEPILWFMRKGNVDAEYMLREGLLNARLAHDSSSPIHGSHLLDALLDSDSCESIRFMANPFSLLVQPDHILQGKEESISEEIRLLNDCQHNPNFLLQKHTAELLLSVANALTQNRDKASSANLIVEAQRYLSHLSQEELGGSLALDLAMSLYEILEADEHWAGAIHEWGASISAWITDNLNDDHSPAPPPAPLVAAANKIIHSAESSFTGIKALPEVKSLLQAASQWPVEVESSPYSNSTPIRTHGPHGDTLVLILPSEGKSPQRKAIRETWLKELKRHGVAYYFVKSGSECMLKEATVEIDPEIDPQLGNNLLLSALLWVYRKTPFAYVIIVKDNVYLNVEALFEGINYRKHHFYGQYLNATIPGALSPNLAICDKSPRHRVAIDSDLAFSLSRYSLACLKKATQSYQGRRLIRGAPPPDGKLMANLLYDYGIEPSNEDYLGFKWATPTLHSIPFPEDPNTFLPNKLCPAASVRVSSPAECYTLNELRHTHELLPKKIWPTCYPVKLAHNSNQLTLLTETYRAQALVNEPAAVVMAVRNEMSIIHHFLDYYRNLGIRAFYIADNGSDDGTREYLYEQPDVLLLSADTEYRKSHYGVTWQQAILGNFCLGKWVIVADADEFLVYPDSEKVSFLEYTRKIEAVHANGLFVHMIDMYPEGDLDDACFETTCPFEAAPYFDSDAQIELAFGGGHYSNSRNMVNGLRHRIAPNRINAYVSQKYAVFKYMPWVRLTEGIHYAANIKVAQEAACFAHFKYHSGFKQKVLNEIKRGQHFNGAEEYRRYASMLAEGKGGFGGNHSQKYINSSSFKPFYQFNLHDG